MAKYVTTTKPPHAAPILLTASLLTLGALLALGGVFAAVFMLMVAAPAGQVDLAAAARAGGFLMGGAVAGCLMWSAAWVVRQMHDAEASRRELIKLLGDSARLSREANRPAAAAVVRAAESLRTVEAELGEISATVLLSDEQRQAKRRLVHPQLAQKLIHQVELAVDRGDLDAAQEHLGRLVQHMPDHQRLDQLQRQVAQAVARASSRGIEEARRAIDEHLAAGRVDAAGTVAQDLLATRPDSDEAASLLRKVRAHATEASAKGRRMYGQVQQLAAERKWSEALDAARKLLASCPDSPEARIVGAEIPTLEDNAGIEQVRRLRDDLQNRIENQDFASACELAERIVATFPTTAAAEELQAQLPKLKDLARTRSR